VLRGFIVPHAPALLLDGGYPDVVACGRLIRFAVRGFFEEEYDVVIVVSPHSRLSGVYKNGSGSLAGFGLTGFEASAPVQGEAAQDLASAWKRPRLEAPLDHGVVVPLLLRSIEVPIVAVGLQEVTGPNAGSVEDVLRDAEALAGALDRTESNRRALVMISAHTSAALSPRAPLLDRPAGHRLDELVVAALESDAGRLTAISAALWKESGSCGVGPLAAAGFLWGGAGGRVLAHESPAGIGYVVAELPARESL
jgi:hypothetical protein